MLAEFSQEYLLAECFPLTYHINSFQNGFKSKVKESHLVPTSLYPLYILVGVQRCMHGVDPNQKIYTFALAKLW